MKDKFGDGPEYKAVNELSSQNGEIKVGDKVHCTDGSYVLELKQGGLEHCSLAYYPVAKQVDLVVMSVGCKLPTHYSSTVWENRFDWHHSTVNDVILQCAETGRVFFAPMKNLKHGSKFKCMGDTGTGATMAFMFGT